MESPHSGLGAVLLGAARVMCDAKTYGGSEVLDAVSELITVVKNSQATTLQGLQNDVDEYLKTLVEEQQTVNGLAIVSGCNIFRQFITRMSASELQMDFQAVRSLIQEKGERFLVNAKNARSRIVQELYPFLRENSTILIHGYSRAVLAAVVHAAQHKRLSIIVTEGRPTCEGYRFIEALQGVEEGAAAAKSCAATAKLIPDTEVARILPKVDVVLLGAGVVTANGGVVSALGTFQVATLAKAINKPVYVCAETLKLARIYPLDQTELPGARNAHFHLVEAANPPKADDATMSTSTVDYTPPQLITQIYTDLGVMTPAAMSDELLKLYT